MKRENVAEADDVTYLVFGVVRARQNYNPQPVPVDSKLTQLVDRFIAFHNQVESTGSRSRVNSA
ncbi:Uu.00g061020.m01.CDS01 [Anthostomella pinea]|uniref:Uu.00g061020.m01.CDS01 n=1 Tax=Anthostomella pinea TaxID=933095 RepID=A0AAI8YMH0_9PEZI|nr:Uu.00g061020.m01.CDS01 [Anthostomella pinea]